MKDDVSGYAADAFMRVISLLYRTQQDHGLSRAQWIALRYFGRANKLSRTVSGYARYHAVTVGAASQMVKALVSKRLLSTAASETDKRVVQVDPTEKGEALLDEDPMHQLVNAINFLPDRSQQELITCLLELMDCLADSKQDAGFFSCPTCVFHKTLFDQQNRGEKDFCLIQNEPIDSSEIHKICVNYQARYAPCELGGELKKALATRD